MEVKAVGTRQHWNILEPGINQTEVRNVVVSQQLLPPFTTEVHVSRRLDRFYIGPLERYAS
jgi:hypothetical protein